MDISSGPASPGTRRHQVSQLGLDRIDACAVENLFLLHPELQSRYTWGEPANDEPPDIVFVDGDCADALNALVVLSRRKPDIAAIYVTRQPRPACNHCVGKPAAPSDLLRALERIAGHGTATQAGNPARGADVPGNALHVLVVDNDPAERTALQRQLLALSQGPLILVIECVASGYEALVRAARKTFDLVLVNAVLPEIDGYTTCEHIKQVSNARVALMIHHPSPDDLAMGHAAGCEHCLSRPPHPTDLRAVLRLAALKKLVHA